LSEYHAYSQNLTPRPQPASVVASTSARPANVQAILGRIEEALDDETQQIRTDLGFDLKASAARKSRCLYELSRAMKGVDEAQFLAVHGQGLKRLRAKLAKNEAVLKAHLSAVGEVAALLQNAIQQAEADGTYSASAFGWAR
jgi:queuine/archaeosine tRNA-ribosyltransferase